MKTLGLMAGCILAARLLSINAYTLPHPLRIRGFATPDKGGEGRVGVKRVWCGVELVLVRVSGDVSGAASVDNAGSESEISR